MECLEPVRIRYGEDYNSVPCGHCKACAMNKQSDWATRLEFESKSYPKQSVLFVGLSYNDEHLPEYGSLCKRDLQLFMNSYATNSFTFDSPQVRKRNKTFNFIRPKSLISFKVIHRNTEQYNMEMRTHMLLHISQHRKNEYCEYSEQLCDQ